ncbi:hypothetical protein [Streptomyces niveus]|uniref:hypothetical protein n=1 Tax=Streptomyces niveus TaxID=193462 RepID=UPI0034326B16
MSTEGKDGFEVWVVRSDSFKRQLQWVNWSAGTDLGKRVRKVLKFDLKPAVGAFLAESMLAVKKGSLNPSDWLPVGRQGEYEITVGGFHFTVDLTLAAGGLLVIVRRVRIVMEK